MKTVSSHQQAVPPGPPDLILHPKLGQFFSLVSCDASEERMSRREVAYLLSAGRVWAVAGPREQGGS